MLQEIEEMATELPGATLAAAARRLAMLAAASGAQGGHNLTNLPHQPRLRVKESMTHNT